MVDRPSVLNWWRIYTQTHTNTHTLTHHTHTHTPHTPTHTHTHTHHTHTRWKGGQRCGLPRMPWGRLCSGSESRQAPESPAATTKTPLKRCFPVDGTCRAQHLPRDSVVRPLACHTTPRHSTHVSLKPCLGRTYR